MNNLLKGILSFIKAKPAQTIAILIVLFLAFNGVQDYWRDFKHWAAVSELKERGIILQQEEKTILQTQAAIDSSIAVQEDKVAKVDAQSYKKKNEKAKDEIRKTKGLIVTDSDINAATADKLVSKYITQE